MRFYTDRAPVVATDSKNTRMSWGKYLQPIKKRGGFFMKMLHAHWLENACWKLLQISRGFNCV